ncbi:MAG: NfeD family protein [Eubacteriales bacterium]|nr:NfeD family protein [Eubacteriales bacterium]
MQPMNWLVLFVVLLLIEFLTMGLTTVWFAGGAIAAMAANMLGGNIWIQCTVFLAVSFILLIFTRPFAARYINGKHTRTNVDELIGACAVVTEEINNLKGSGKAKINGLEWTARTKQEGIAVEKGKTVEILSIEGVKLIVKEKEEN